MNIADIRNSLPHRYPILLVDKIFDLDPGVKCKGVKNITLNEPCYKNLQDNATNDQFAYPHASVVESFAQVGALLVLNSEDLVGNDVTREYVMLAGSVSGMQIMNQVFPGEVLIHCVSITKQLSDTVVISGSVEAVEVGSKSSKAIATIDSMVIAIRPKETIFTQGENNE